MNNNDEIYGEYIKFCRRREWVNFQMQIVRVSTIVALIQSEQPGVTYTQHALWPISYCVHVFAVTEAREKECERMI